MPSTTGYRQGESVRPTFAWQLGIRRFYHYEKFNADHLLATLRDQKIHCSSPANLNDPWDCRPWLDSLSLQDPEAFQKAMASFYRQADKVKQTPRPDLKQWESGLRNDPKKLAKWVDDQSKDIQRMVSERRIYCVTPDAGSILMWSHYADNHLGICLEFGVDNPLFRQALQVLYASEYPLWITHEFEAKPDRGIEMILTKAEEWRYEKEFRLISLRPGPKAHWLRAHDDFFSLPPGALKSVIVGCEADYDAVWAIVKAHIPDLPVKRAVRVPNRYRLEIEGIVIEDADTHEEHDKRDL
jgi:hypothetical protein